MKDYLVYVELLQFSIILFLSAILVSFIVSTVFTEIDIAVEKLGCGTPSYNASVIAVTFFQLFVIAIFYYLITEFIKAVPSLSTILHKQFKHHKTINFTLHIVLIVLLMELNPSIKHNLHELGYLISYGKYNYICPSHNY